VLKEAIAVGIILIQTGLAHTQSLSTDGKAWDRYLPEKQRIKVYEDSLVSTHFTIENVSGPIERSSQVFSTRASADCLWVTEIVARTLVSTTVDEDKITADVAEEHYQALRPADTFLLAVRTHGLLYETSKPKVVIVFAKQSRKIEAEFVKPPFDIRWTRDKGPTEGRWLVSFPRVGTDGQQVIKERQSCRVELQFPGRIVSIQINLAWIVTDLRDL
jgi:hypothetical protein